MSDTYIHVLRHTGESDAGQVSKAGIWAADALEQARAQDAQARKDLFESIDEGVKQHNRIEQLEAALNNISTLPAHDYCDTLVGFAGAVHTIARKALESARGKCPDPKCTGIMDVEDVSEHCSCHINPPCSACTEAQIVCMVCGLNEDGE